MKQKTFDKIGVFVLIAIMVTIFSIVGYVENNYTRKDCKVIGVYEEIIDIKDNQGNIWTYELKEGESFYEGQTVDLKMFENVNKGIQDDVVTKVIIK